MIEELEEAIEQEHFARFALNQRIAEREALELLMPLQQLIEEARGSKPPLTDRKYESAMRG